VLGAGAGCRSTDVYNRTFEEYSASIAPDPAAARVLAGIKNAGGQTGVASNSPGSIVRTSLQAANLQRWVDVALGVEQVKVGKPAPDLILLLLERLRVDREKACYVGDSIYDRQAAAAAGVFFVGYRRSGDRRIERLQDLLLE
jgi:phosphoglycolate phosphatase-like HAD superfamily hydrolase